MVPQFELSLPEPGQCGRRVTITHTGKLSQGLFRPPSDHGKPG
jgi:hypothetical protein